MADIDDLMKEAVAFRDARDWKQFHNAKDVAVSLVLEAAELLERFQWKTADEAITEQADGIREELADVLMYALILAYDLDIDLTQAIRHKITVNCEKYPVELARGSRAKYDELRKR